MHLIFLILISLLRFIYTTIQCIHFPVKGHLISWYFMSQIVKNLPSIQEIWVPSLGQEDPREKGMTTYLSTLS